MTEQTKFLIVASIGHFLVDLLCVYTVLGMKRPEAALWYNTLAFGLQPLFGILSDAGEEGGLPVRRYSGRLAGAAVATVGLAAALWLWNLPEAVVIGLLGTGNALYHVSAGRTLLFVSKRKQTSLGIFVSPGALGVGIGSFLALVSFSFIWFLLFWLPIAIFIIGILLSIVTATEIVTAIETVTKTETITKTITETETEAERTERTSNFLRLPEVLLLLFSIWVRSYGSFLIVLPARPSVPDSSLCFFLLVCLYVYSSLAAALGKAFGGVLADRKGGRLAGVGSLLLSIPFLLLGRGSVLSAFVGLLLFQMNMPITLCLLAEAMPGREGFAFGLTTLALLAGYFSYRIFPFSGTASVSGSICFLVLTLLSAGGLFLVLRTKEKRL